MKFTPVQIINVYYIPKYEKILVGRLALKNRKIFFEYDPGFISKGINLSPFLLPLQSGVVLSKDSLFEGLYGVFNDSLPDGWVRLLLDRALMKHQIIPGSLSVLDRLSFVGSHGMGALLYEPEVEGSHHLPHITLDEIEERVIQFQEHDNDSYVEDLLKLGGSSSGARPKVLLNVDDDPWIIKFPSSVDLKDMGAIEYAYYLMAMDAGLDVVDSKLFPSRIGPGFFGAKRFDRVNGTKIHMHTVCGLLHADHRVPNLDYEQIIQATMHLTRNMQECEKQYRQCVFNVLTHNRDDHSKNFSFLMDDKGNWCKAPAYDLTFSSGPGGEHCSMVMGEGKNPGLSHLLQLAKVSGIKSVHAVDIINEVKESVVKWQDFAQESGVSHTSSALIDSAISRIVRECF